MKHSVKFWIGVMLLNLFFAWLMEVPIWVFPVVAIFYVSTIVSIEKWQKLSENFICVIK